MAGGEISNGVAEKTTPTPTHWDRLSGPGPPPTSLTNFGEPPHWLPGRAAPTRERTRDLKVRPTPAPASPRGARSGGAGPTRGSHAPRLASGPAPAAPGLQPGPRAARCWLPATAGFVPRADSPSLQPSPRLHPPPTRLVKVSPRAASPAPSLPPPTGALTAPQTNHRVTNRSQMQIPRR